MIRLSSIHKFLKNPLAIFVGVVGGVLTGQLFPTFGREMGGFGLIVIDLMKMCILPILFTSVSISIAHFLTVKAEIRMVKVLASFLTMFLLASIVGITTAFVMRPGYHLDTESSHQLRHAVIQSAQIERALDESIESNVKGSFMEFIQEAIPKNIFQSIALDRYFQVLSFSIIFGITLGLIAKQNRLYLVNFLGSIREIFEKIFSSIVTVLPIAIFFIMAMDVAKVGADTLISMVYFIISAYIAFFVLFLVGMGLISYRLKLNPLKALKMIQEPLVISIVTHSGVAAIPSTIKALTQNYKMNKTVVSMLSSIGIVMGQFGTTIYFAFASIFVAQFYNHGLAAEPWMHLDRLLFTILMTLVASFSSIGSSGTLLLPLMSIILDPLGLPITALLVLFLAIDPIIDPFRSMMLLHANISAVVLAGGGPLKSIEKAE